MIRLNVTCCVGLDSNQRSPGYEPGEIPSSPPRGTNIAIVFNLKPHTV